MSNKMNLSIYEVDMITDALTRRAARYDSMACDEDISLRRVNEYERRASSMRSLRDRFEALKKTFRQMSVEAA